MSDQRSDFAIIYKSVAELKPYERNARTHSRKQIRQIADSIKNFGFINPVVVDENGRILAGHGRVEAAKLLGANQVPTISVEHLSEDKIRAYILADNRIAEKAGWDKSILALEFQELIVTEPDLDISLTGFEISEIEQILGVSPDGADDDADAVEIKGPAITKKWDLWLLGEHRLLCGDATSVSDFETLMAGKAAAMAFTDPPYNIDYKGGENKKRRKILNDNLGSSFGSFLQSACGNILKATDGATYICMSSSELHTLQEAFIKAGGHFSTFLIWAKNNFTLGRSDYQRQYEPILYGWREGASRQWCGDRSQSDIWFFDKPVRSDIHPTMKPIGLVMRAIRNSSEREDIILDPFLGSGTTLVAAERTKRVCYGMELDPLYVDASIRRWQRHTGKDAVHAVTKHTFNSSGEKS